MQPRACHHCVSFIDDMAGAYEWADLVICRAGALTIAELAAAGVPASWCLFRMPWTTTRRGNARFLVNVGGAFLLPQTELTPEAIALIRTTIPEKPTAGNGRKGQAAGK